MKYRANPVIVDAFRIKSVRELSAGTIALTLEDCLGPTHCSPEMTSRFMPAAGDYYVVQSDGYAYLNPKDVFERKILRASASQFRPLAIGSPLNDRPLDSIFRCSLGLVMGPIARKISGCFWQTATVIVSYLAELTFRLMPARKPK